MKVTKTEKILLYAVGECYMHLNKPLEKAHLQLSISKIIFIELLLNKIKLKQPRTIYKNLERLEEKKLIQYTNKTITFTSLGLKVLKRIQQEIKPYLEIKQSLNLIEKPKKKLQTRIIMKDINN